MLLHRHKFEVLTGSLRDWVFLSNFLHNGFHFSLGLPNRNTRLESPNSAPLHIVTVGGVVWDSSGEPDTRKLFQVRLWWKQQFKTRGQHANHDGRRSKSCGDRKRFINYGPVATKALLKVFVAENNHVW